MKHILFFLTTVLMLISLTMCTPKQPIREAGTIERDTILGVPCRIYLPDRYEARADKEIFPVLYLQHGMFGSEDDWTERGDLLRHMDSLLQCNAVKEMVVIMPDNFLGSIPPAERQELMAAPDITPSGEPFYPENGSAHWRKLTYEQEKGYEMSGYWEKHFPEFMTESELRYSISKDPSQRAIAGLSMGGFHTMHISHYLCGAFRCVGLFSPAVIPTETNEIYDNWENEVRLQLAKEPLYWVGIGNEDFLYDYVQQYRNWLQTNHLEYTYYESSGGHTWPNWQDYLCRFLKKI